MDLLGILKVASGISSALSLAAFLGALYFWLQSRESRKALFDSIVGQGLLDADTVVKILNQFKDEQKKLDAFKAALAQQENEQKLKKAVIAKTKEDIDPIVHNLQQQNSRTRNLIVTAIFFIVIAVVAYGVETPIDGCSELSVQRTENAMFANFNADSYGDADRAADDIIKCQPSNYRAWNVKGSVAFYERRFQQAVEFFTKALLAKEGDRVISENLADSFVETGAIDRALEIYRKIEDGSPSWSYKLGRAYLYAGQFDQALKFLQSVPTASNLGSARILEAAALLGKAKSASDFDKKGLRSLAEQKLREGIQQDKAHWRAILTRTSFDKHEGYDKAIELTAELVPKLVK